MMGGYVFQLPVLLWGNAKRRRREAPPFDLAPPLATMARSSGTVVFRFNPQKREPPRRIGLGCHKTERPGLTAPCIVPLMELVYGDCVALYPHMSEKIGTNGYNTAKHVATDILYAENPLYQLTDGVYYENDDVVAVKPSVSEIKQTGSNTFQITYQWEALEDVSVDAQTVFTHFTSEAAAFREAKILFQEGHNLAASASTWKKGDIITDGPYTVTITNSSSSRIAVMTMLLGANGQRLHLSDGNGDAFGRYLLGYLCVGSDGALRFEEAAQLITDDYEVFSRNDAGYGEEQSLGYFDTLMKNSYDTKT